MDNKDYKILITTSGKAPRLGRLDSFTNNSLLRVGKRPVISYIIDSYPKDTDFVITLGHFGDQIKDFLNTAYKDRKFDFVEIDKYTGEGSSLGYTLLQVKDKLQCPFIYHAGDTIVKDAVAAPDRNWIGGYKATDSMQYASLKVENGKMTLFDKKGSPDFDYVHIGLVSINNYKDFWGILEKEYKDNPNNPSLGDASVIHKMLERGNDFEVVPFSKWLDVGSMPNLESARKSIDDKFNNLDKEDESIFLFEEDKIVVKFFHDEKKIKDRVERAKSLKGLVPDIENVAKNFYSYKYVEGDLYADVVTPTDFHKFLDWSKKNLWKEVKEVDDTKFKEVCNNFYYTKTMERVEKFLNANNLEDMEHTINDERVPTIKQMIDMIDFDWLSSGKQTNFHGDFILDNMIRTKDGYKLIDWRQDFGGLLKAGDMYYDLAKLNHNLTVNHDIIHQDNFIVREEGGGSVFCDIHRKETLLNCQKVLIDFAEKNKYDVKKIKTLTAIIWLNMAPLHHYPFNLFLYYFGKLNLWRILREEK